METILGLLIDIVKGWLGYQKEKTDAIAGQAALLQLQAERNDHELAEEILTKQRALNPADVQQLLKPPADRIAGASVRAMQGVTSDLSEGRTVPNAGRGKGAGQ